MPPPDGWVFPVSRGQIFWVTSCRIIPDASVWPAVTAKAPSPRCWQKFFIPPGAIRRCCAVRRCALLTVPFSSARAMILFSRPASTAIRFCAFPPRSPCFSIPILTMWIISKTKKASAAPLPLLPPCPGKTARFFTMRMTRGPGRPRRRPPRKHTPFLCLRVRTFSHRRSRSKTDSSLFSRSHPRAHCRA